MAKSQRESSAWGQIWAQGFLGSWFCSALLPSSFSPQASLTGGGTSSPPSLATLPSLSPFPLALTLATLLPFSMLPAPDSPVHAPLYAATAAVLRQYWQLAVSWQLWSKEGEELVGPQKAGWESGQGLC